MKQLLPLATIVAFLLSSASTLLAQAPDGFTQGWVITGDNTRLEGFVKEKFKSKSVIVFQGADGKKTTYNASDIKEAGIGTTTYTCSGDDFFKVISKGGKASLYQKVSDASGKVIYNGSQAVGISSGTPGSLNDYFIQTAGDANLKLVTKKNFEQVLNSSCTDCPGLLEMVKTDKINYEDLDKAIEHYNACR